MTIIQVCPLSALADIARTHRPSHVISLLSPEQELDVPFAAELKVLRLRFHDIGAPTPPLIAPDNTMIESLLEFSRSWRAEAPMVIHCWAGISRSSAAAYIVACAKSPGVEGAIAETLRVRAPFATPNRLMVAIADRVLGREGRMIDAIDRIGRGAEAFEGTPYELPVSWDHRTKLRSSTVG